MRRNDVVNVSLNHVAKQIAERLGKLQRSGFVPPLLLREGFSQESRHEFSDVGFFGSVLSRLNSRLNRFGSGLLRSVKTNFIIHLQVRNRNWDQDRRERRG